MFLKEENPCFFGGFPLLFPKKQGLEVQGKSQRFRDAKLMLFHLNGQNRQSPIASVQRTRSTLASHSAVPRGMSVKRMNANRAIRIAAQRMQGLQDWSPCFGGDDRQQMLAIRIAAITLACASAITLARFRPSKLLILLTTFEVFCPARKLSKSVEKYFCLVGISHPKTNI